MTESLPTNPGNIQMKEPLHARAISLALALSVVVGGWLLFEYSNRPVPQTPSPASMPGNQFGQGVGSSPTPSTSQSAPLQPQSQQNAVLTFKCEKNGRIQYGDQPCGADKKTVSVVASEKTNHQDRSLSELRTSVAQMEASRLERERKQAAVVLFSPSSSGNQDGKELRCKNIDEAIAGIDSRLRQPYDAHTGDYFKSERKKLTDQRFSLGC